MVFDLYFETSFVKNVDWKFNARNEAAYAKDPDYDFLAERGLT